MTNCLPPQITEENQCSSPDWISYGNKDPSQSWLLDQIKQLVPTERWLMFENTVIMVDRLPGEISVKWAIGQTTK